MSVRQLVVMADTPEGQIRVDTDIPLVRKSWLLPLGCAAAQRCWLLARLPLSGNVLLPQA